MALRFIMATATGAAHFFGNEIWGVVKKSTSKRADSIVATILAKEIRCISIGVLTCFCLIRGRGGGATVTCAAMCIGLESCGIKESTHEVFLIIVTAVFTEAIDFVAIGVLALIWSIAFVMCNFIGWVSVFVRYGTVGSARKLISTAAGAAHIYGCEIGRERCGDRASMFIPIKFRTFSTKRIASGAAGIHTHAWVGAIVILSRSFSEFDATAAGAAHFFGSEIDSGEIAPIMTP